MLRGPVEGIAGGWRTLSIVSTSIAPGRVQFAPGRVQFAPGTFQFDLSRTFLICSSVLYEVFPVLGRFQGGVWDFPICVDERFIILSEIGILLSKSWSGVK